MELARQQRDARQRRGARHRSARSQRTRFAENQSPAVPPVSRLGARETQDFKGTPEIKAIGTNGRDLNFAHLGVKPTQDWKEHHAVFNSLDASEVNVYL